MAAHLTHKPQGVAFDLVAKAYLSSDHVSAATGKTIAVQLSKNKAAFGNPSAGAVNMTEIANGWYYVNMSTTDEGTQGPMICRGTSAGVDDVEAFWFVVDAHNAGFDGVLSAAATGDAYARIGVAGAGLTALGDTRVANLDATVSSRSTFAGGAVASVTADVGITQAGADKVWASAARSLTTFGTLVADMATAVWGAATRLLTAGTNIVLAKGVGITGLNDIAATAIVTGGAITTSAGKISNVALVDTTTTNTDMRGTNGANTAVPDNAGIAAIKAKTDNLTVSPADETLIISATNAIMSRIGAAGAALTALGDARLVHLDVDVSSVGGGGAAPSAADVADAVWDELLTAHVIVGSAGAGVAAAGSAGDPWGTPVPGAYAVGTAGNKFGSIVAAGAGAITWTPEISTNSATGLPLADVDIWISTDAAGLNVIASGRTGQDGLITTPFHLDPGLIYVFRQKTGFDFVPGTETVA